MSQLDEMRNENSEPLHKTSRLQRILADGCSLGHRLRCSISKAVVDTRVSAAHRFSNAQYIEENPEITAALEILKNTKQDISAFEKMAQAVYYCLEDNARIRREYGKTLETLNQASKDQFQKYISTMANVEHDLHTKRKPEPEMFREKVLVPLQQFLRDDIEKCQEIKLEYKQTKSKYDISVHTHSDLSSKKDSKPEKISHALVKKSEMEQLLKQSRERLQEAIQKMEKKKNEELIKNFQEFWNFYEKMYQDLAMILVNSPLKVDLIDKVMDQNQHSNGVLIPSANVVKNDDVQ